MADVEHVMVPVPGGELFVARFGEGALPVVAAHGITFSHGAWLAVADELPETVTLYAPDLRGRGASTGAGPWGMAAHARDLVTVLDYLGADRALVVGHSMGCSVIMQLVALHPERVKALLLVDGGIPPPVPEAVDPEELLAAILGPALQRLDLTFSSVEDYFAFWREHPSFSEPGFWAEHVERFLRWDLGGEPPELRSRVVADAVREDGRDMLLSSEPIDGLLTATCPVTLLRAPRGLLNDPSPLIPDEAVEPFRVALPQLVDEVVPDTNHYSILMGKGTRVVAGWIRRLA
ncbi:MAG: alpha/beta hydrolase [Acidimicrobiia bacterium]